MSTRKPPLTQRRIRAALAALNAMQASGEPGEGDWPPDVTPEDVAGAIQALQALAT